MFTWEWFQIIELSGYRAIGLWNGLDNDFKKLPLTAFKT